MRKAEGPVHDRPRAELVGQVPAIGAEQAGRQAEGRGRHARRAHVDAVDVDQVVRQPQRQRHEGAEDEEVVEREPPDLQVLQRRELLGKPGALAPSCDVPPVPDRPWQRRRRSRPSGQAPPPRRWPRPASHRPPSRRGRRTWSPQRRCCPRRRCPEPCPDGPRHTSG